MDGITEHFHPLYHNLNCSFIHLIHSITHYVRLASEYPAVFGPDLTCPAPEAEFQIHFDPACLPIFSQNRIELTLPLYKRGQ